MSNALFILWLVSCISLGKMFQQAGMISVLTCHKFQITRGALPSRLHPWRVKWYLMKTFVPYRNVTNKAKF